MKYYIREIIGGVKEPSLASSERDMTVSPRLKNMKAKVDGTGFVQVINGKVVTELALHEVVIEAALEPSPDLDFLVKNLSEGVA